jgi:hypothetical protein
VAAYWGAWIIQSYLKTGLKKMYISMKECGIHGDRAERKTDGGSDNV